MAREGTTGLLDRWGSGTGQDGNEGAGALGLRDPKGQAAETQALPPNTNAFRSSEPGPSTTSPTWSAGQWGAMRMSLEKGEKVLLAGGSLGSPAWRLEGGYHQPLPWGPE